MRKKKPRVKRSYILSVAAKAQAFLFHGEEIVSASIEELPPH